MTQNVKLALVGCGAISPMHLRGIKSTDGRIVVTAAIDPVRANADKVARQTGAEVFSSLGEALERGEFEAVDILVPHHLHAELAEQAFTAGKHVLLEKPMGPTVEACERILAAARDAGTVFMVAENAQYWPEVVTAKTLIDEGQVGELVTASAVIHTPLVMAGSFYAGDKPWRFDNEIAGGGLTIDTGSHWIRPLRMWLGEIDEVIAATGRPPERMQGESLAKALFRFESGLFASFEALLADAVMAMQPFFRIQGSRGEIVIESDLGGRVKLFNHDHPGGEQIGEQAGYLASYGPQFVDFAAAILDGKIPDASAEYSLGELRTALAMYRSVHSRTWEKVWGQVQPSRS